MWFKFKINCAFGFLYISNFFSSLDELAIVSINSSESIKISFSMDISINGLRCSWGKEDRSLVLIIFSFENTLSQVVCVDGNSNTNLYNVNKLQNKLDWHDSSWSKINAKWRHLVHLSQLICSVGLTSISSSSSIYIILEDLDLISWKSFSDTSGMKLLYWQANCFSSIAMISLSKSASLGTYCVQRVLGKLFKFINKSKCFRIQPI